MGFALFTQSGTFNPSSYGLSVGDVVHVAAIGGGGSGYKTTGSRAVNGAQGGTTSFGSILTCAGGLGAAAASGGNIAPQAQNDAALGGYSLSDSLSSAWPWYHSNYGRGYRSIGSYHGGCGANGFFPGGCRPSSGISILTLVNLIYGLYFNPQAGYADIFGDKTISLPTYSSRDIPLLIDNYRSTCVYCGQGTSAGWSILGTAESSARTDGRGGHAQRYAQMGLYNGIDCIPIGGLGYGAGGASGNVQASSYWYYSGSGGNSGVFKETEYTLTASSIAVTIGAGGTAADYGGGGCCGCVAIWW